MSLLTAPEFLSAVCLHSMLGGVRYFAGPRMKFSLIIRTNEAKNILLLLEQCSSLANSNNDIEIILVDTVLLTRLEVLAKSLTSYPMCRSVRVSSIRDMARDNGRTARRRWRYSWLTHADMQTDPTDALEGLKYFDELGSDVFVKANDLVVLWWKPLSGMSVFESLLLRKAMWDINAQPTMFSKEFFQTWECPPYDFSLDLYAYYGKKKELRDTSFQG